MYSLTFALIFLLAGKPSTPVEETWPQWRGPNGDSVAPNTKLPTHWSKTENVAWKTPIPGWGNSTPAIWRDAMFITTQDDDKLLLLRLDRATGKIVWQREVGQGEPRRKGEIGFGRFHDEQNMATPSPVTDGKHVWAHFGNGDLACYDFEGKQDWKINLKDQYGVYSIWWGHANSPLLVDDLIISVCIQDPKGDGKSYVVAHEQSTGKKRWLTERMSGAKSEPADSYTTPILHRQGNRTEVIVYGGNILDAYEPTSGKRLWQAKPFTGNRVISGPTLHGDHVYAVQGMRGPLFAIKAGGESDVTASHVTWKYTGATPDAASPVLAKGLVFLATNNGIAICIDAANGQEVWKERLAKDFRATPLVVGDQIYFLGKDGKATVVAASREFQMIATSELNEEIIASPATAGGLLFLRTKSHVYCIGSDEKTR